MRSLVVYIAVLITYTSGQNSMKTEFFVAFPKSIFPSEFLRIFITTQHDENTTVLIRSLRDYSVLTFVQPGVTREINPPTSFDMLSELDHDKGIWIRPTNPAHKISVSVMKLSFIHSLSGSYLAMPPITYPNLQEYEYFITSYLWDNRLPLNLSSTVVLVGCKANTSVVITPSQRVEVPPHFIRESYPQGLLDAGESYTVLLQPMETLHLASIYDLTATRIVSDKPITVLGSHECADVPLGAKYCDYLVEQLPPTVTWGRLFLLTSPNSRLTGEQYKIIAMKSLTSVKVKCVVEGESNPELGYITILINASGDSREFSLGANRFCSVVADKPILMVQYSSGYFLDHVGDPFMLVIPPIEQYSNNYTVTSPASYHNHLTITVPLEYYGSDKILLNGTTISEWSAVYCSDTAICGYATRLPVLPGTHRIRHVDANGRFMAFVYGFQYRDGYGQIAGMQLEWIADVCEHGALRLSLTSPPLSSEEATSVGAFEICVDGVWTSMCSDGLSNLEASVACMQLGFSELGYGITVEISSSSPTQLYLTHNPATLVCQVFLNTTLQADQTIYQTWSKDAIILVNSTHQAISEKVVTHSGNDSYGVNVLHFESKLTVYAMMLADNGTYTCSAAVVSSSDGQPLSSLAYNSVVIGVIESEYQLIQIRLLGVGSCFHWLLQYELPLEKIAQIKVATMEHMQSSCPNCGPVDTHLITGAAFRCFSQTANQITLRARLHAPSLEVSITVLVGFLQEWVSGGPSLSVSGVVLRADKHCEVVIESFEAEECAESATTTMASLTPNTPATMTPESITTDQSTSRTPYAITHVTSSHNPTEGSPSITTHVTSSHDLTERDPLVTTHVTSSHDLTEGSPSITTHVTSSHDLKERDPLVTTESAAFTRHPPIQAMVIFVGIGGVIFVITILIISVVCMVVIISCLQYRNGHVISTTPFPLPLYDDPVTDNLCTSPDFPAKFLEASAPADTTSTIL